MSFLPIRNSEMAHLGWEMPDFVIITGDAYVDHPSFGTAVISRVLQANGYRVAIIPQPVCDKDYTEFGIPRLAFLVNSGNIDSMVAHYTAAKKKRSNDMYSPGGKAGLRPDRAVTVYCKKLRQIYGNVPIAIGGIEASLRRFAHYDYWLDKVLPSILVDSTADLLMYGMGEKHIVKIADRLNNGENIHTLTDIPGTCYLVKSTEYKPIGAKECPSYDEVSVRSQIGYVQYAKAFKIQQSGQDPFVAKPVIQKHGGFIVVQNPPEMPLSTGEMDSVYSLPYERTYHPIYEKQGGVPGIEEVKFSVIHNRGCMGNCAFCALAYHQGRYISARSHDSVLDEVDKITKMPDFKGYIHDVGGPTANFRFPACEKQSKYGFCTDRRCLAPTPCKALRVDHSDYLALLRKIRGVKGVKKVFIRSGIRFDYLIYDEDEEFFRELVKYHVSGQLKVAPEHVSDNVLKYMGKPSNSVYNRFKRRFYELSRQAGKEQYLVPYLMSSHPGSTINDAIALAQYLKSEHLHPEQVQDFYPTPGTASTCMYYTGLNPDTMEPVFVPKSAEEKAMQRALLQYYKPENRDIVLKALKIAHRTDLIGTGKNCLVADYSCNKPVQKRKKTIRNIHKPKGAKK